MPIQKLDLLGCTNLTGEGRKSQGSGCSNLRCCPRATTKRNFPGVFFIFPQPSLHCTTSGDIKMFKDMPIKELYLGGCKKLTGVSKFCWSTFQSWIMLEGCCPKATTTQNNLHAKKIFQKIFFIPLQLRTLIRKHQGPPKEHHQSQPLSPREA